MREDTARGTAARGVDVVADSAPRQGRHIELLSAAALGEVDHGWLLLASAAGEVHHCLPTGKALESLKTAGGGEERVLSRP